MCAHVGGFAYKHMCEQPKRSRDRVTCGPPYLSAGNGTRVF